MPVGADVIDALIQNESSGNPRAYGKAGEIGLGQVKPSTAAMYGITPDALWHPDVNRMVTEMYLTDLVTRYKGDLPKALAAYKSGPGNVDRGIIPDITRSNVNKILAQVGRGQLPPPSPAAAQAVRPWRPALPPAGAVRAPIAPPVRGPAPTFTPPMTARAPVQAPVLPTARPSAPQLSLSAPSIERAATLLEERMRNVLLTMGIPHQIAQVVASAYADVYKLPAARPKLIEALMSENGMDELIAADQPRILRLLTLLRLFGGTRGEPD